MRRFLRVLVAGALALSFTGGVSTASALARTPADAAHPCAGPKQVCNAPALTSCCCPQGAHGAPIPTPSPDRTSITKAQSSAAALALVHVFALPPLATVDLRPLSPHRLGPPLSLSILNASLLL